MKNAVLTKSAALLPVFLLVGTQIAFAAATTNIAALDTAKTSVVTFVQGLATFAAIFLLGVLVWDFVQHRNIARSIFEFLGVIVLGVIAVNAQAISTTFGTNGAIL